MHHLSGVIDGSTSLLEYLTRLRVQYLDTQLFHDPQGGVVDVCYRIIAKHTLWLKRMCELPVAVTARRRLALCAGVTS